MMDDPLWFKDAILYELHVRAYQDSNNDGVGDFAGLTERLDYLADLGINTIWVLPFMRSPLKDDGYDIADYFSVHPAYGTLDDFRSFLARAHALGMRVITELVINHTSDQHAWFQRARTAPPSSVERNFYVWTDNPERYANVPLMFPDFETSNWAWDPVAKQYYWHRFYSHQPDLNFDNPAVRDAILPVLDFWFEMGVDGLRLDAIPYLFEREGTACEHLPETHAFLKNLRQHVSEKFPGRIFLAEANAWPDDMVEYFGKGEECQMAFHFPLMPRLFMALLQESRFPIVDILAQTPPIPNNCQWCLFLRNHDEMTLAAITDEERDAMYRAYAQDRQARLFLGIRHRLAPLLRNDRRRIELLNAILFSLPGSPVLYYGDEIGMGDNIYLGDRNGVRTPMQWSDDRNAGFSRANTQKLYLPLIVDSEYNYVGVNVEAQQNNPSSLLWWVKRLIALRKRHPAFGRGDLKMLEPQNPRVLAYVRHTDSERLLIVANLSRFVQNVQFDLSDYARLVPEELFGRTRFPAIREQESYGLTLGPHGFYWFALVPDKVGHQTMDQLPTLPAQGWPDLISGRGWEQLAGLLVDRHAVKSEPPIVNTRLIALKTIPNDVDDVKLLVSQFEDANNQHETIFQPIALVAPDRFEGAQALSKSMAIAKFRAATGEIVCDPLVLPEFRSFLLTSFQHRAEVTLAEGHKLSFRTTDSFNPHDSTSETTAAMAVVEETHPPSTFALSAELILRLYRRPDEGLNPDVEICQFLKSQGFDQIAELEGTVEYQRPGRETVVLGGLHRCITNQGSAWHLILDQASRFFDQLAAHSTPLLASSTAGPSEAKDEHSEPSDQLELFTEPLVGSIKALASFTARLQRTLASAAPHSAFAPEPAHQRSHYQTLRNATGRLHAQLTQLSPETSDSVRDLAKQVLKEFDSVMNCIRMALLPETADGCRIRAHGHYVLRKLLVTGQSFILSDFEGVRHHTIGERRVKKTPFYDVAMLLASVDDAVASVLWGLLEGPSAKAGTVRYEDREKLRPATADLLHRLEREFLSVYTSSIDSPGLLPQTERAQEIVFQLARLRVALENATEQLGQVSPRAFFSLESILSLVRLLPTI